MKKGLIIFMSLLILIFSVNLEVFAKSVDKVKIKQVETSWESKDGIKITVLSDHKLTNKEKEEFENGSVKKLKDSDVIINQVPSDFSSTTLSGPEYRTFNNTGVYEAIEMAVHIVSAWFAVQVGATKYAIIKVGAASYFNDLVNDAIGSIPRSTYWGFWTTKAYSSYYGADMVYDTMVRYAYSNYTSPTDVYYYQTGVYAPN